MHPGTRILLGFGNILAVLLAKLAHTPHLTLESPLVRRNPNDPDAIVEWLHPPTLLMSSTQQDECTDAKKAVSASWVLRPRTGYWCVKNAAVLWETDCAVFDKEKGKKVLVSRRVVKKDTREIHWRRGVPSTPSDRRDRGGLPS